MGTVTWGANTISSVATVGNVDAIKAGIRSTTSMKIISVDGTDTSDGSGNEANTGTLLDTAEAQGSNTPFTVIFQIETTNFTPTSTYSTSTRETETCECGVPYCGCDRRRRLIQQYESNFSK